MRQRIHQELREKGQSKRSSAERLDAFSNESNQVVNSDDTTEIKISRLLELQRKHGLYSTHFVGAGARKWVKT